MGKVDDYTAGRSQGLILAREIVKKDGIEGLEKEIQFRNITGINTALTRKELNIACEKIKNMTLDTMMVIAVATLHDEFGFAGKRCKRFIDRMNLKAECLVDNMATWDEYTRMRLESRWRYGGMTNAKNRRKTLAKRRHDQMC